MEIAIVGDGGLDSCVCRRCKNYLSVGPITVSRDGTARCGRCRPNADVAEFKSLYNLLAEKLVFRCSNYALGCKKINNSFHETFKHEKICRGYQKCSFCDHIGNGSQLIQHCYSEHAEFVVRGGTFKFWIREGGMKRLIFLESGPIINIKIVMSERCMKIHAKTTAVAARNAPKFKLKFFNSETSLDSYHITASTEREVLDKIEPAIIHHDIISDCFPYGQCWCRLVRINENVAKKSYFTKIVEEISQGSHVDILDRGLARCILRDDFYIDRFLNMPPSDLKKVISALDSFQKCVRCKQYITSGINFCPQYHLSCDKCAKKECPDCTTFHGDITHLHCKSIACDWDGCCETTNIFKYMTHKRDCKFRRYKCPDEDCAFVGCFQCLQKHWHLNTLTVGADVDPVNNYAVYWLSDTTRELYFIRSSNAGIHTLISVDEVDVVLSKIYKFKLFGPSPPKYSYLLKRKEQPEFYSLHAAKPSHFVRYLQVTSVEKFLFAVE